MLHCHLPITMMRVLNPSLSLSLSLSDAIAMTEKDGRY
jgi:hypothetical protein